MQAGSPPPHPSQRSSVVKPIPFAASPSERAPRSPALAAGWAGAKRAGSGGRLRYTRETWKGGARKAWSRKSCPARPWPSRCLCPDWQQARRRRADVEPVSAWGTSRSARPELCKGFHRLQLLQIWSEITSRPGTQACLHPGWGDLFRWGISLASA